MKGKLTININPQLAVPVLQAERVAWLNEHGVLPSSADVCCEAELSVWSKARVGISASGNLDCYRAHTRRLEKAVLRRIAESGRVPDYFDVTQELTQFTSDLEKVDSLFVEANPEEFCHQVNVWSTWSVLSRANIERKLGLRDDGTLEVLNYSPESLFTAFVLKVVALVESKNVELQARRDSAEVDAKAAEIARQQAIEAEMASWIAKHGTPSHQER